MPDAVPALSAALGRQFSRASEEEDGILKDKTEEEPAKEELEEEEEEEPENSKSNGGVGRAAQGTGGMRTPDPRCQLLVDSGEGYVATSDPALQDYFRLNEEEKNHLSCDEVFAVYLRQGSQRVNGKFY